MLLFSSGGLGLVILVLVLVLRFWSCLHHWLCNTGILWDCWRLLTTTTFSFV